MTVSLADREAVEETEKGSSPPEWVEEPKVVPIEFAGWLPCFEFFGDCGHHPQFSHTDAPPAGYRFVRSEPKPGPPRRGWGLRSAVVKAAWAVWMLFRPVLSIVHQARSVGPGRSLRTLADVICLFFQLRRAGCEIVPIIQFLRTRHFASQVMLPTHPDLLFLTSIPYTFGRHPWIIEIEDATTLLLPFHMNGCTSRTPIRRSPYLQIVKAMLESDSCRGIITHMRSTAEALPKLFQSDVDCRQDFLRSLRHKFAAGLHKITRRRIGSICFSPAPGIRTPKVFSFAAAWTWCALLRPSMNAIRMCGLTLRTGLPKLKPRFRRVLEKCWVRVIDRYLARRRDGRVDAVHPHVCLARRPHSRRLGVAGDGARTSGGRLGRVGIPRVRRTWPQWHDRPRPLRQGLVDGRETGMMRENYDRHALLRLGGHSRAGGDDLNADRRSRTASAARPASPAGRGDALQHGELESRFERGVGSAAPVSNTDYKELTCESM